MDIIKKAIAEGKNVVVAGSTSAGTTATIEASKTFYPSDRILSVEAYAEFTLSVEEVARIKSHVK